MPFKQPTSGLRRAAVAGSFYPASAQSLRRMVADFLAAAPAREQPGPSAIIVPHAGYVYSGPVAAQGFASVQNAKSRFRRAVVVGPSHFVRFRGIAAPSHAAFATPLGEMPVDRQAIDALADADCVVIDDDPHAPDHALEVELPFLQTIFGDLPIVPLLFGVTSAGAVAAAIAPVWADDTLLVVSSDLSHYEGYDAACRHDRRTAAAIDAFDETAIGPADACGHLAIRGALIVARQRALSVERLDLRNSGDTAGDRQSVVGYGAWAIG